MRYYPATSQSRGLQTLSRLRRRLDNSAPREALAPVLFDLSEWADLAVAPHETVERAATLVRVFAEDFEFFSKNAALILAGEEENIPCSDAARPLWVAVSEAARMAEELRELTRNPQPYTETPAWLERAMDAAIAASRTKH